MPIGFVNGVGLLEWLDVSMLCNLPSQPLKVLSLVTGTLHQLAVLGEKELAPTKHSIGDESQLISERHHA